jgi:hypothetical protein
MAGVHANEDQQPARGIWQVVQPNQDSRIKRQITHKCTEWDVGQLHVGILDQ